MITETINNISICNSSGVYQSLLLLSQNSNSSINNLPYVSFSININPFKRIKKASLYLRILNAPSNCDYSVSLRHSDGVEDEFGDKVTINGETYLFFDLTLLLQQPGLSILYRLANHISTTFTIMATASFVDVLYDDPYDYLGKQQLINFNIGKTIVVAQDILTFNTYISKLLFDRRFLFDYRLVYDYVNPSTDFLSFFPLGWKVNVLETITQVTNGYQLNDQNYNRRLFKPSNDSAIFVDSTGTGLLLELQSDNTYKIFDPVSSFFKLFDTNGKLTYLHFSNGDSLSIAYSTTLITISDSRQNVITIEKTNNAITITSNTINQTYTLGINNSNLLESISFISCLTSVTSISDSFTYANNRINKITSFDNYSIEFLLENYKITSTLKFKTETLKIESLEYKHSYVIHTKAYPENTSYRYYFNADKNFLIGGENTGVINNNDKITFVNDVFSFEPNQTHFGNARRVTFFNNNSSTSFTISNPYSDATIESDTITVDQNSNYLFIAKFTSTNHIPTRNNNRRIFVRKSGGTGDLHIFDVDNFNEQYCAGLVNTEDYSQLKFVFVFVGMYGAFEISNVLLIKITSSAHQICWCTNPNYIFPTNIVLSNSSFKPSIHSLSDSIESEQMSMNDIRNLDLIRTKFSYPKYVFSNDLKCVQVLSSSSSCSLLINGNSYAVSSVTFVYIKILSRVSDSSISYEGSIIVPSSQDSFTIQTLLCKNGAIFTRSSNYDFDGNLLLGTDYRGVVTTNTYDSNKSLTSSVISHPNSSYVISKSFTYDSNKRPITETSLVGSQQAITSKTYVSTLDLPSTMTDAENRTFNFIYSPRYEYLSKISVVFSNPLNLLIGCSVATEKDKYLRTTKYIDQGGEYHFTYDENKNKLKKIQYYRDLFVAPFPFSDPGVNEPMNSVIPPYAQAHIETMFEITPYDALNNDGEYKFPNGYQYYDTYDNEGRFSYREDTLTTNGFLYDIYYQNATDGGNVSQIIDESGNENETISFAYSNGRLSSTLTAGYKYVTRNYTYDDFNRLFSKLEIISEYNDPIANDYSCYYQYTYDDIDDSISQIDILVSKYQLVFFSLLPVPLFTTISETRSLDLFGRVSSLKTVFNNNIFVGFDTISYHTNNSQTSYDISRVTYCDNTYADYGYDKVGNVTSISGTKLPNVTYEYDELNRLIKETHTSENYYIEYSYTYAHNITSATKKRLDNDAVISSDSYSYNQGDMTNRLDTFNNVSITYDSNSNITSFNGASLTYYRGNKMSNYSKNGVNAQYKYNGLGLRTFKRIGDTITRYIYDGDRLTREIIYDSLGIQPMHQFIYLYGISGLIGFVYDGLLYLYEKDLLSNIIAIYLYSSSAVSLVNKYQYDAYGNTIVLNPDGTIDTSGWSIGNLNPFRYKSYYYDGESGFYYCQARYYSSILRRWLSLDDVSYLDNKSLTGLNLYAYCGNNPVMNRDEKGHGIGAAILVGLIVGLAYGITKALINDYNDDRDINGSIGPFGYIFPVFSYAISGAIYGAIGFLGATVLGIGSSVLSIGAKWLRFGISLSLASIEGMSSYAFANYNSFIMSEFAIYALSSPIKGAFAFALGGALDHSLFFKNKIFKFVADEFFSNAFQDPLSIGFDRLLEDLFNE